MATRSAMDSGLHTGTEYDTCGFALGEWRTVRSFDPIRHRWVTDYAAPIVAKRGVPVDGDAQLERERLPSDNVHTGTRALVWQYVGERIVTVREVAAALNVTTKLARQHLQDRRHFEVAGETVIDGFRVNLYRIREGASLDDYYSKYEGSLARRNEQRMERAVAALRAAGGSLSRQDLAAAIGIHDTTLDDFVRMSNGALTVDRHYINPQTKRRQHMIMLAR